MTRQYNGAVSFVLDALRHVSRKEAILNGIIFFAPLFLKGGSDDTKIKIGAIQDILTKERSKNR
jgi:hypothetical protein